MNIDSLSNSRHVTASEEAVKKPYVAPVLREYGSVHQFTQGSKSVNSDGNGTLAKNSSDRTTKQNIVRIGTHHLGIGLYLFDYKPEFRDEAGYGRQFGVMADEVEAVLPLAVGTHPRGHKMVDYAMLGIRVPGQRIH